ncbi:MAG: membrane-bound PQQ-dependent dehydrogenase, glucose/quinate/shikimate family, partial [Alcaligenaceae bacterium]
MLLIKKKPGLAGTLPLLALGVLFLAAAIFFIGAGTMLIGRGGSWYYLISGLAMLALAWGLFRNKVYVGPLYVGILGATVAWSFWEAGLEFWPLFARIFFFVAAGALLAFSLPALRRRAGVSAQFGLHATVGGALVVVAGGMFAATFQDRGIYNASASTATRPVTAETEQKNWMSYGSNPGGERFAAIDQINRSNVANLDVAWTFRHGDVPVSPTGFGEEDQSSPLQVGNTVFFCTHRNNVLAINATTGQERWRLDMQIQRKGWLRCRGLVYHDASGAVPNLAQAGVTKRPAHVPVNYTGACQRRIVVNTLDAELVAINADTGEFCSDFGSNGRVDLKKDMGTAAQVASYRLTSPPTLAGDALVVGGFVSDNVSTQVASGVIRAFDVLTGDLRWAWDSGNPAVTGAPTPEQPYTLGSPNAWAPMSYDPENDLIVVPTGNNATDVRGGNRDENRSRYATSIVALRGSDGRPVWSFQPVHHDLWDNDVPMLPTLTTFPKNGQEIPAVVV